MYNTDFDYINSSTIVMKVPSVLWKDFEDGKCLMNWSYMGDYYGVDEKDFLDDSFMFADKERLKELNFSGDPDTDGNVLYDEDYDQSFMDYDSWYGDVVNELNIEDTYMKGDMEYSVIIVSLHR